MSERLRERVEALVEAPLTEAGYELADLAVSLYRNQATVRLFVYGESGVSLEDCARLSRRVGEVIDGSELFEAGYTLEVSSPGLDRPLKTARDFHFRRGEKVDIMFADRSKKKVTAQIVSADDNSVRFENETGSFSVPLTDIERAKIVF